MSSAPSSWASPWFLKALDEPPLSFRNPWLSQPLVGNEPPYLKRGIHCYTLHIMLLSFEPQAVNQRKIIKGKRHMKKGGKIKVGVSHASRLLPPIHYIPKCGLPSISFPCTPTCGLGLPLSFTISFISLSHATTIWRMYLEYTIPFKGRNHLIGYLVNPPLGAWRH